MSTLDLAFMLRSVEGGAVGRLRCPLRMVLMQGEAMALPLTRLRLRILWGTAWISQAGRDSLLQPRDSFDVCASPDRAVISGVGSLPLCFEML
jgi:hypothetical protein